MLDDKTLPNNVVELKEIINNLQTKYENTIKEKENELKEAEFKYHVLEEKFHVLQRKFFGKKSEKISDEEIGQMRLFNEAELGCNSEQEEYTEDEDKIIVKSYARRKKRKETFPAHLPVKEKSHNGTKEEQTCPCCGKDRPCIGEKISREIDVIPEQIRIIKHIQKTYGPCDCETFRSEVLPEVITAKKPMRILPGTIASEGLLAYIFISKFLDSLPFYRQEKRFSRLGIEISRTNMCNWLISASRKCQDLLDLMWNEVRSGPFIQMDETGMQVLKEPGRPAESKGYMFVTIGYTKNHKPIVIYHYHRTRNKKIVAGILKGFKGYLQTDGLGIYNDADKIEGIERVGCGAHLRRYFYDAAQESKGKTGIAHIALSYYGKISKIERTLRGDETLSHKEFEEKRRKLMMPILKEFHEYLIKKQPQIPPSIKLGEAINYALKEWANWIKFLDRWFMTPDNNYTERKVKAYVIGRKNWMFADTLSGAHSSSTMYSLIQSAEANGLNPYWYLRYLFVSLPYVETAEDMRNLLPTAITKEQLVEFQAKCV